MGFQIDGFSEAIEEIETIIRRTGLSYARADFVGKKSLASILRGQRKPTAQKITRAVRARFTPIMNRFFVPKASIGNGILRGKLVMLSYSLPAVLLNPEQTTEGVTADGSRFFRGAFIAPRRRGFLNTFVYRRKGRGRLPLVAVRVPIQDESEDAFRRLEDDDRIFERFLRRYIEDLKFAVGLKK